MHNEKEIKEMLANVSDYPIWFYKELEQVDIDYVIWNLLREKFVVDIQGVKFEFTFGKNRKHEIIQYCRRDDMNPVHWPSYEVINKAFQEGTWFKVTEIDTTELFRIRYKDQKEEKEHLETVAWMKKIMDEVEKKNESK